MRIGLMLRVLDEKGGIGIYARYLTETMLALDRENDYFLYYRDPAHVGRFSHHENVTERAIRGGNKAIWDQVKIPLACWRDGLDVLFHLKFTVPLMAPCKTVMVLHGAGWFTPDAHQFWSRMDLAYVRTMMPVYCRRAARVISVSQTTADAFERELGLPAGKIETIYTGVGEHFKRQQDDAYLESVRTRHDLPERFVLTVTGYDRGPRKNIKGILEAFRLHHGKTPHKLVVAGKDCHRFREDHDIPEEGWGGDVLFPGWIEQEDLPAFYTLADLFLFPSKVEGFGIPVIESLACGTPVLISNDPALVEIAGGAGLTVAAESPESIAAAIARVLTDAELRESLSRQARARAAAFSWDNCARQTLRLLEDVAG